VPRRVTQS